MDTETHISTGIFKFFVIDKKIKIFLT